MNTCYLCGTHLERKNKSEEHIIPNALGGRLKSKNLLCISCNSKFGEKSDAGLAKQLNYYSNVLMIKRERGEPQSIIMEKQTSGEKYRIDKNGIPQIKDPKVTEIKNGDKVEINIQARSTIEAKKILLGMKKKYPQIDIDEFMSKAIHVEEQITEPLHIQLTAGGKEILPSVLKTALNYYIELTRDILSVAKAIECLKCEDTSLVEPIILEKPLFDISETEVSHGIFIYGRKDEKKLYAIIDYFNIYQFLVKLSDTYESDDFESLYVYDIISQKVIDKKLNYVLQASFVFNFTYPESNPNFDILKKSAERVMKIALERQHDNRLSSIVQSSWDKTINKLIPEGELITEEANQKFIEQLMKELDPYIRSLLKHRE